MDFWKFIPIGSYGNSSYYFIQGLNGHENTSSPVAASHRLLKGPFIRVNARAQLSNGSRYSPRPGSPSFSFCPSYRKNNFPARYFEQQCLAAKLQLFRQSALGFFTHSKAQLFLHIISCSLNKTSCLKIKDLSTFVITNVLYNFPILFPIKSPSFFYLFFQKNVHFCGLLICYFN